MSPDPESDRHRPTTIRMKAKPPTVAVVRQPPHYEPALVRQSVAALGIDWPALIRPGDRVLLKPNFIRESHSQRPDEWEQIITHGTVISAVAEQAAAALDGRGTITVADAPQTDSDFEKICERAELSRLR